MGESLKLSFYILTLIYIFQNKKLFSNISEIIINLVSIIKVSQIKAKSLYKIIKT